MSRLDRLRAVVADAQLDALVVTDPINVRYLTGFVGSSAAVVVRPDGVAFLTDFRYAERVRREVADVEHHCVASELLDEVRVALPAGAARVGFESDALTVTGHGVLAGGLPSGVELVATRGHVERLRAVKDADELRRIADAAALADEAIAAVLGRGLAGRRETEVVADFEIELRRLGAEQSSFAPMCLAGAHGDAPHGRPGDEPIPRDVLVVLDFGVVLGGYCSDCTRTVATGAVGEHEREVHELVRAAQAAAFAAVRPGVPLREVDRVARDAIAAAGHGERFGHGTGHGVGMRIQEDPRLTRRAEGKLVAGNVVTVEPGVYVPGRFGVRIEDLVVVTEDGARALSGRGKELEVIA